VKKAVITAAGLGTRFLPVVKSVPKEMLAVINKPIIQYVVEECVEAGIKDIVIVVRQGNTTINDYFNNNADDLKKFLNTMNKPKRFEEVEKMLNLANITTVTQSPELPYVNGSPILAAKSSLNEDEPFAMCWGDDLVLTEQRGAMGQLIDYYENEECDAVMGVQKLPSEELYRYGIIEPIKELSENDGIFKRIIEKPDPGEEPSNFASYGRQILPYKIFEYLQPDATGKDGELWLQDANDKLAKECEFRYKVVDGEWMTTGDPIRLFEAEMKYTLASKQFGEKAKEIIKKLDL